jgi:hypothetical protein
MDDKIYITGDFSESNYESRIRNAKKKMLIQITYKDLCFAVETTNGVVTFAAPVAKWMVGKRWHVCRDYWENRNAKIVIV